MIAPSSPDVSSSIVFLSYLSSAASFRGTHYTTLISKKQLINTIVHALISKYNCATFYITLPMRLMRTLFYIANERM